MSDGQGSGGGGMGERPDERAIRTRVARRADFPSLERRLRRAALARGVDYDLGGGRRIPIDMMPSPVLLTSAQLTFLRRLAEAVNGMLRRLPELFLADAAVRAALPFPEDEEALVRDCYRPHGPQTLVTRVDFDLPNAAAGATRRTVAFEPNGVSIGGIFYGGECARVVADVALDERARRELRYLDDACQALPRLLRRHAAALGFGPRLHVAILEDREWDSGITEMPRLAATLEAAGISAVLADPRDLALRGGRVTLRGRAVDLIYRNMEARDLCDIEATGTPLRALREAFRRNLVVSGIAGDFDHKSVWEVLTSGPTRHVVPPALRPLFARHLLWTRVVRERRTEGPGGGEVDLIPFVRRGRGSLVLKPNRECGGEGVTLGPYLDERAWDRALDRALAERGAWAVQKFHPGSMKSFTRPRGGRRFTERAFYTFGVIATQREVAVVGRACLRPIVNVSAGGGMVAVMRRG
jgi:hypothetical protein